MREEAFALGAVPAVVYGAEADRAFLFVHGRCGCKEEGRDFAALAAPLGWQVLAVDLPEHGATVEDLRRRESISTEFAETLSWRYYQYALAHPTADWPGRTEILYAGGDSMTPRATAETFAARPGRTLTVMEGGEHWFHTPEQLAVLERWTLQMLTWEGGAV